ncbi:Protein Red [Cytospora mali]|uniref:Protein Red n=1 Tax=Cytospora mali TaxID=578113 RepID=A0A194VQ47_CYTMA|nr:Protein Red [Valsa mali]
MNNDQFRKLLLANSGKSPSGEQNGASASPRGAGTAGLSSLGSRKTSSIPMTPRSVAGTGRVDFARQLAERNNEGRPQKKYRTSAPKGSRFAEGYVDRAKERKTAAEEEDDKAARIMALEESMKKEEIDQATFEKLRAEIAGGDLSSTHLIKGLDFKLLARVRKGEDVFGEKKPEKPGAEASPEEEEPPEEDVDGAFEQFEGKEVTAVVKEKAKKKGQLSTTTLVPGQKRSRDQILAEMKAAREAAKAKQEESALGARFKRIGAKKEPGTRIERDAKGREVLIIIDEDGNEKRKVRKVAAEVEKEREAFKVDPNAKVLGDIEVPEYYQKKLQEQQEKEDEDVKMFSDVESDYDPLNGIESDSDDSDKSGDEEAKEVSQASPKSEGEVGSESPPPRAKGDMAPPAKPQGPSQHPRNYFKSSLISEEKDTRPALNDPSVLAALKKAKTLNAAVKTEEEQKEAERQERLNKMLRSAERDDQDLDMGFGTNRMEDEEDMEDDGKVKLSAWGDEDDDGHGGGGKSKRKRGPKKKKGDVNNISHVMQALEKRKAAE